MNLNIKLSASAFLAGFLIMVLEVAGARMLYPFFGSSLLIWTMIIGIFMVAMALGYHYGGRISNKKGIDLFLSKLLAIGAVLCVFLPLLVPLAVSLFKFNWAISLFLCSVLISLPCGILAMVSPILIEKVNLGAKAGSSAGSIYAISTIGSVFGTFLSGFVLLPNLGVIITFVLCSLFISILSLLFYKYRIDSLIFCFVFFLLFASQNWGIPTYYYTAHIAEEGNIRYLEMDGKLQSALNLEEFSKPVFVYTSLEQEIMQSNKPKAEKIAIIGAGGCTQYHHLKEIYPKAEFFIIDIDKKVFDICSAYFYVSENENIHFIEQDGRAFLTENSNFDIIIVDAFSSGCSLPSNLIAAEFFEISRTALQDDGFFIMNIILNDDAVIQQHISNTLSSAFPEISYKSPADEGVRNFVYFSKKPKNNSHYKIKELLITDDKNPIEFTYSSVCLD